MKVLVNLFKGTLWLLLLLLVLALLTALSWWMQWPLVTGAVLLLSLIGLVLAFFAVRALYRWQDKRRFVRRVLDEQAATEVTPAIGRMAEAWQQGMAVLRTSPYRFHQRLEFSQPWFLVLDATGATTDLFTSLGETLPAQKDAPLFWHFLSASVLLHCPETQISADDWQELLAKLAGERRRIPLRGIVVLLSVADCTSLRQEERAILGRRLRTRVQQIMLSMNRSYPVYVLTEGLETLSGMDRILETVPAQDFDAVLGLVQKPSVNARDAAKTAAVRLEEFLRMALVETCELEGDTLAALLSLRALGDNLHMIVEQISLDVAHQARIPLAGVCFCEGGVRQRHAFLTGLLSYVLPAQSHAEPLTHGLPFLANTRLCVMGAWLVLLLGLCGVMSVNVLYQHQALTESVPAMTELVHDEQTNKLYQEMLYIEHLEKAEQAWYLPRFGLDALSRVLTKMRAEFVGKVYAQIVTPLLRSYRSRLASNVAMTKEDERKMFREILWLTAVVSNRLSKRDRGTLQAKPFPLTTLNTVLWNPVNGRLIAHAVHWMARGGQIESFAREMRSLLAYGLASLGNNFQHGLLNSINSRYPAAKICLAQFWPHISVADPNNVCIQPAYTTTGYTAFKTALDDLNALDDETKAIKQNTQAFAEAYFRHYAEVWVNFTKAFAKILSTMQEGEVFASYTDINKIEDMPHYRAMQTMANELVPLRDAGKESPRWLSSCMLMDTALDIAAYEHTQEAANRMHMLLALVADAPELLKRVRAETKDAKQARQLFEIAENIRIYFDDILALLQVVAKPEKSYALASAWFSGHALSQQSPGTGDKVATEDLYANAKKKLDLILPPLKSNGKSPMLSLLPGLLDFIGQGVTIQAAKIVQEAWEKEVLSSPAALYRQDDVAALFGEKGVVPTFVRTHLTPFLTRKDKVLAAASWGDIDFPFTTDGLKVLSQAEMIEAQPPEDTYYVELRSQPTLVNVDARERADATSLTLQCRDKSYTLVNRNYPREEKFQYTVKQCSTTTLEVRFPSFTLVKSYDTFTDFLKDFQYGEREFLPDDFEKEADAMESAGVQSVTVRILADNVASVLQKEGNSLPTLPDRLTYVW